MHSGALSTPTPVINTEIKAIEHPGHIPDTSSQKSLFETCKKLWMSLHRGHLYLLLTVHLPKPLAKFCLLYL